MKSKLQKSSAIGPRYGGLSNGPGSIRAELNRIRGTKTPSSRPMSSSMFAFRRRVARAYDLVGITSSNVLPTAVASLMSQGWKFTSVSLVETASAPLIATGQETRSRNWRFRAATHFFSHRSYRIRSSSVEVSVRTGSPEASNSALKSARMAVVRPAGLRLDAAIDRGAAVVPGVVPELPAAARDFSSSAMRARAALSVASRSRT